MKFWLIAILIGISAGINISNAIAESKSGVDPRVISLPKGPGSIEGLGESFEPQINTGTATYAVKIAVSPGVNKFQPEVALEYNGGYGNSPLGLGWNLNLDFIQRQTDKGLPGYTDNDTFVYGKAGELVPLANDIFRLKIEGLFMKFQKNGDSWEAWRKNGHHVYFGTTAASRLTTSHGIFQWFIDREIDTNGNQIQYIYETSGGQVYLSEIRYSIMGEDVYKSIRFVYEARPDAFTDYHSRSRVLTDRRLVAIEVNSNGVLVRKYRLEYKTGTDFSLLARVFQVGADGQSELPPVSFDYTVYEAQNIQTRAMTSPPPVTLTGNDSDLVDIDGDSLPDVVNTSTADGQHYFYLNRGRGAWEGTPAVPAGSPQYFLDSAGVMMSDMNGDGLSDLFVKTDTTFGYFKNKGDVTWEDTDWQVCTPNPNFSFDAENVRMIDVNNDKLIDVMMDAGSGYYYVWLNHQDNQWNTEFDYITCLPDGSYLPFSSPYTKIGDMNGDHIQDLVFVIDGYVSYFPGMGNGEFDAETIMANPPVGIGDVDDRLALSDINNDGLADLVRVGNQNITAWFNAGDESLKDPVSVAGTPPYVNGVSAFRFADMNADGFTDLLFINNDSSEPYQYVDFNDGIHPNLLSKITNGLGREITITYRSSTEFYLDDRDNGTPWTTKLPFPVYVVSQVTVKDNNSNAEYVTQYKYRDGYYDGAEKAFRGFGAVDKIVFGDALAPTLKTRYEFDVGKDEESRKGMILSQAALEEAGTVAPPSGLFDIQNNSLSTSDLLTGTNGERVRYSYIEATDTFFYENTLTPEQTRQEFVYDDYGNLTEESNYGLVSGGDFSVGGDEVRTFTTYLIDTDHWMLDRPLEIRKENLSGGFLSHQKNFYNTQGNLIEQQGAITDGVFITTLENDYDAYGNITTMTDGNEHWREIGYDPIFHTFPVSEQIGETGLTMTAEYDTGLGAITSFTDFNNNETTFGYDTFGRLTAIVKPGDSAAMPTQAFIYTLADPVSSVMTRSREVSGNPATYDAVTYYDGMGRKLLTKAEGPANNWVVSEAVTFNARGGIREKWLPYFTASMAYELPDPAQPSMMFEYDAKGRSIKEVNPDGSFKTTGYSPLQTTVYDEDDNGTGPHAGTPHVFINDGLERLMEVHEQNGVQTYNTFYEYDGLNNLTKITDDQGNIKTMAFDGLGRKVHMNDPDKHEMTYAYDPAGNLISTTDAKGQTVTYTYDPANRILTENFSGVKVAYHYDEDLPAAYPDLANTMGKLAWVEDAAGEEYYSYDARGNTAMKIREVSGYTFINKMAYDALDRMTAFTYPDGYTVAYQYNTMNQLGAMPGFVTSIDYIATGQKAAFVYQNGINSQYTYDNRQRLNQLTSTKGGTTLQDFTYVYDDVSNITEIADGRPAKTTEDQTRAFVYDDLYRLTSAVAPAWTRTYQYSSIGNMTFKSDIGAMTYGENGAGPHAVTSAAGAGLAYAYDDNGNISAKTPGYTYQFDHKDRMTGAERLADSADIAYTYDYKGNRVTKTVTVGADVSTTIYADKFTELRKNTLVKQVFAGDRLVARISGPFTPEVIESRPYPLTAEDFDTNPADGVITLAEIQAQGSDPDTVEAPDAADALRIYLDNLETNPGLISFETMARAFHEVGETPPQEETVRFYLPDHLGSASLVTDESGAVVEESVYYPYGADRARTGDYNSEYRFTGKELDDETGLHYFGARYYDSQTGRFVSVDPLYVEKSLENEYSLESLNLYVYSENNPIKYRDFEGLYKINIGSMRFDTIDAFSKMGERALGKVSPGNGGLFKAISGNAKAIEAAIQGKPIKASYEAIKVQVEVANSVIKNQAIKLSMETIGRTINVLENGYDELTDKGYTLSDVKNAWLDAPALIKYGLEDTDASIEAGIEGFTTMTAVTINTIANIRSGGIAERLVTGEQVRTTIENSVDWAFKQYDKKHGSGSCNSGW